MVSSTDDLCYRRLIKALAAGRKTAAITPAELARELRKSQQFISKYESGERRLDAIEFADVCQRLAFIQEPFSTKRRQSFSLGQKKGSLQAKPPVA